jgi:hypothetical protein
MPTLSGFSPVAIFLLTTSPVLAAGRDLDSKLHHLRAGDQREWADFPAEAEGPRLTVRFTASSNKTEHALRFRQQDVRQTWRLTLNGKEQGRLISDENDMVIFLPVPAGALSDGENTLRIEATGKVSDDIRVGEIALDERPVADVLSEATVDVADVEEQPDAKRAPVPCRITVLSDRGALMAVGAKSDDHLAVRPGVIYTADGKARFGLPAGSYSIYAGRGFEYGIDSTKVILKPGDVAKKTLTIRREVPTGNHASCDTHVHTLTHSGHGDATMEERVITIAGEGIELPVATDHNKQIDYAPNAEKLGVRRYFTPIIGNEVTSLVGHVNIFPVMAGGPAPNHEVKDWKNLFAEIAGKTAAQVMILNHPRDQHLGFRPFGPEHHLGITGENLDGWELQATAMEVVNSGAQQTDVMRLYRDWFGLLNRGLSVTAIGASDSHDVSRYIVGQARTYVKCKHDRPGEIEVNEVVKSFREGRVSVSCGLLTEIRVNDKYGPGDTVAVNGDVRVDVRVLGPSWTTADHVALYANGVKIKEAAINDGKRAGVKCSGSWTLPRPKHDVHLVAIATGPADTGLYWPIARPYQPTSQFVNKRVSGSTGAVWLDADGDGKQTSAFEYALRLHNAAGKWQTMIPKLADYDEAVAAQAAGILQISGVSADDPDVRAAARTAGAHVERAFTQFAEAWRESRIARRERQ